MMTQTTLAEIVDRNQGRQDPDVTALLAEVGEQRNRQTTAIGWISRDVVPNLKDVWRYLLYQKEVPKECLVLDNAISKLEGDLMWLGLWDAPATESDKGPKLSGDSTTTTGS
jgi:hypothetical protein